eukprot:6625956-Alexandrium_andersonii.AAC.1
MSLSMVSSASSLGSPSEATQKISRPSFAPCSVCLASNSSPRSSNECTHSSLRRCCSKASPTAAL